MTFGWESRRSRDGYFSRSVRVSAPYLLCCTWHPFRLQGCNYNGKRLLDCTAGRSVKSWQPWGKFIKDRDSRDSWNYCPSKRKSYFSPALTSVLLDNISAWCISFIAAELSALSSCWQSSIREEPDFSSSYVLTDLHPLTSPLRHSDTNFEFNQHSLEEIIVISSLRIITKCLWSHTVKLKPTLTSCYQ